MMGRGKRARALNETRNLTTSPEKDGLGRNSVQSKQQKRSPKSKSGVGHYLLNDHKVTLIQTHST